MHAARFMAATNLHGAFAFIAQTPYLVGRPIEAPVLPAAAPYIAPAASPRVYPAPENDPCPPPIEVDFKTRQRKPDRHWESCLVCFKAYGPTRPPKRWFGLCASCYGSTSLLGRRFYKNATARWRKASITDFGKADTDEVQVFSSEPSPLQIMLLRLIEAVGVSTRDPDGDLPSRWGLAKRLGISDEALVAALKGKKWLTIEAEARLIVWGMMWFDELDHFKDYGQRKYGDDDEYVDPESAEIVAVRAMILRSLGRKVA